MIGPQVYFTEDPTERIKSINLLNFLLGRFETEGGMLLKESQITETIENLDFGVLFDKYYPKREDFWYLDPPYIISTEKGSYYMNNFTMEDHTRLRDRVHEIDKAGGKFMVSYDHRPEVKELYKYWIVSNYIFWKLMYSVWDL